MNDKILILVLVGVIGLAGTLFLIFSNGDESSLEPFKEVDLEATVLPWETGDGSDQRLDQPGAAAARTLRIYLDTSHPMGGFLDPGRAGQPVAGFRTVAQIIPDPIVEIYRIDSAPEWRGIDTDLVALDNPPAFEPDTFRGARTHLDLAVTDALMALRQGEVEVAVLVTDLVATRAVTGPLGVSQVLLDWMRSPEVLSGAFDVGLLGVRAPYRGVTSSTCPGRKAGLGCWYSERSQQYIRMNQPAERPFYLLVLGRSGHRGESRVAVEDSRVEDSRVERVGRALEEEVAKLELETQWELLTGFSRPLEGRVHCRSHSDSQHVLWRNAEGHYLCQQAEQVHVTCESFPPLEFTAVSLSWDAAAEASVEGGEIVVRIDCQALRRERPATDLSFEEIVAQTGSSATLWDDWSCSTDELEDHLGQTLQLNRFVRSLGPERYRVRIQRPLLRSET